jgi:hypothetical protein
MPSTKHVTLGNDVPKIAYRNYAVYLSRKHTTLSNPQIGAYLGNITFSAVTKIVSRPAARMEEDRIVKFRRSSTITNNFLSSRVSIGDKRRFKPVTQSSVSCGNIPEKPLGGNYRQNRVFCLTFENGLQPLRGFKLSPEGRTLNKMMRPSLFRSILLTCIYKMSITCYA